MEIEKQCCTLAQAKQLKELGIEQKSVFTWCVVMPDPTGEQWFYYPIYVNENVDTLHESIAAAFTVAELGQMLGRFARNTSSLSDDGNEAIDRADDLINLLTINELYVDGCNERLLS